MNIDERVEKIQQDINDIKVNQSELFTTLKYVQKHLTSTGCVDHEKRIRQMEQRINMLYGVILFLSVVLPVLAKVVKI